MKSLLIVSTLIFGVIATVGVVTEKVVLLTIGVGGATLSLNVHNDSDEEHPS